MALGSFHSFGEVFLDVANSEQRPPDEVAGLDGFEPGGFDWVSKHGMHPFDGLLGGRQVVDTVGLLQGVSCFLGWVPRLPVPFVLHKRDSVASMIIAGADEEGLASASDEYVCVFMYSDPCLGEDGDGTMVTGFADAHEGLGEIIK